MSGGDKALVLIVAIVIAGLLGAGVISNLTDRARLECVKVAFQSKQPADACAEMSK